MHDETLVELRRTTNELFAQTMNADGRASEYTDENLKADYAEFLVILDERIALAKLVLGSTSGKGKGGKGEISLPPADADAAKGEQEDITKQVDALSFLPFADVKDVQSVRSIHVQISQMKKATTDDGLKEQSAACQSAISLLACCAESHLALGMLCC